jgi:protein-tyrosine-phosphatase
MAEALLRAHVNSLGVTASVRSAGTMAWDTPPLQETVIVMREHGIDVSQHRPTQLTAELIEHSDLVLGMTRNHVGRVVNLVRDSADRAFLVAEFVRLAAETGVRRANESERDWVRRVAAARPRRRVAGRAGDEVTDPLGEPIGAHRATAARLDSELRQVAALLSGRSI